ncbi:MAG: hypothetical protein ACE5KZ_04285 [Candidatus Scalinduaceae bacterium]
MWKAYYADNHRALWQELVKLLRSQFNISLLEAMDVGEPLARATMKFEKIKSNYKTMVIPDLELAYTRLKKIWGVSFNPKEAAYAELDWWVARRTPGIDSPEEVGRRIARLYALLFGKSQQDYEKAGLLRAKAAHIRDKGGKLCDWDKVELLLLESYRALQEAL